MAPYPTKDEIAHLASHLSTDNFQPFYDRVAQDVTWDVLGQSVFGAELSRNVVHDHLRASIQTISVSFSPITYHDF